MSRLCVALFVIGSLLGGPPAHAQEEPGPATTQTAAAGAILAMDEAEEALAGNDVQGALEAMASIAPEMREHEMIAPRRQTVLRRIEPRAAWLMAGSEALVVQKQYLQAADRLKLVAEGLEGTTTGQQARQRLLRLRAVPEARTLIEAKEREERARAALDAALERAEAGPSQEVYAALQRITNEFPNTPAAAEAATRMKEYEAMPQVVQEVKDTQAADQAKSLMGLAYSYRAAKRPDLARQKYQQIIDQFPGTSYAEEAQKELDALSEAPPPPEARN